MSAKAQTTTVVSGYHTPLTEQLTVLLEEAGLHGQKTPKQWAACVHLSDISGHMKKEILSVIEEIQYER